MMNQLTQIINPSQGRGEVVDGVATIKGFEWIFNNIVTVILGFAGIALFIMLIVGGFGYITSAGDPKKAEAAKNTITYGIGGLVLIALAYLILLAIQSLTGINLSVFQIYQP
jgi:hypothetical protein